MYTGRVKPDEKRFTRCVRPLHKIHCCVGKLLIYCFHAFTSEGTGVLNLAIGIKVNHIAGSKMLAKLGVLGVEVCLGFFFCIQVAETTEKLVEPMVRREEFVLVAQMILAELSGSVAKRLEQLCDRGVFWL